MKTRLHSSQVLGVLGRVVLLVVTQTSSFHKWYVDPRPALLTSAHPISTLNLALDTSHALSVNVVINVRLKPTCKMKGCVGLERNLGPSWMDE